MPSRVERPSALSPTEVVATINKHKLYRDDLPVKEGTLLEHYIYTWATYTLLGMEAERSLPAQVVERARRQANFMYYKLLADALLDTLAHQLATDSIPPAIWLPSAHFDTAHLHLMDNLVRVRLIAFRQSPPPLSNLRALLCDTSGRYALQIDSLCRNAVICLRETEWHSEEELGEIMAGFESRYLQVGTVAERPLRENSNMVAYFCVHEVRRVGEHPPEEWLQWRAAQLRKEIWLKRIKDSLWIERMRKAISLVNIHR